MRNGRFNFVDFELDFTGLGHGNSDFGLGHPRGLDLRPELPLTTDQVVGIDLTHIIHVHEVESAKGGNGGGGGGGGGGVPSTFPFRSGSSATATAGHHARVDLSRSRAACLSPPRFWP